MRTLTRLADGTPPSTLRVELSTELILRDSTGAPKDLRDRPGLAPDTDVRNPAKGDGL